MADTLYKLQPDRTMYLRGFSDLGAGAAIHDATPTGFQVSGVFRDPADFAVGILNRFNNGRFGNFLRGRLHHDDGVFGSRHHQVQGTILDLAVGGVRGQTPAHQSHPHGAHRLEASDSQSFDVTHVYDRNACQTCGTCTEYCDSGTLEFVGRSMTVEEVLAQLDFVVAEARALGDMPTLKDRE